MKITLRQVEKSRQLLKKLAQHQETVARWESAVKNYKPPEGHRVVEVQFTKDGQPPRHVTERDDETVSDGSQKEQMNHADQRDNSTANRRA